MAGHITLVRMLGHKISGHKTSGHKMSGHKMSGQKMSGHKMSGHQKPNPNSLSIFGWGSFSVLF